MNLHYGRLSVGRMFKFCRSDVQLFKHIFHSKSFCSKVMLGYVGFGQLGLG